MPESLVKFIRNGLVEQEHFGYILLANKDKIIDEKGNSNDYPFYLRSCAKPLQASLLIDFGMDKYYDYLKPLTFPTRFIKLSRKEALPKKEDKTEEK